MASIRNAEDFNQHKSKLFQHQQTVQDNGGVTILVSMGSCGISVGAKKTWDALSRKIESENLTNISMKQTGCLGLCGSEPIVQIKLGDDPLVIYGNVTPELAIQIIEEHVLQKRILTEALVA
jgi:(2Fe-2S) ferredoxin